MTTESKQWTVTCRNPSGLTLADLASDLHAIANEITRGMWEQLLRDGVIVPIEEQRDAANAGEAKAKAWKTIHYKPNVPGARFYCGSGDAGFSTPSLSAVDCEACLKAVEAHMEGRVGMIPECEICGKPATCYGEYEGEAPRHACDDCCGHGNEDGHCEPVGRSAEAPPSPSPWAEEYWGFEAVPPSSQPGTPLTLEQAVAVLNERRHKAFSEWKAHREPLWVGVVGTGDAFFVSLSEFEAIAVAEKYLRDAAPIAEPQPWTRLVWRRASEERPDDGAEVLVAYRSNTGQQFDIGWFEEGEWRLKSGSWQATEKTHWRPFPSPPDATAQEGARDEQ